MRTITNRTFDEERALYGMDGLLIQNCSFDGPADGESALKECSNIIAEHCFCNLRYPFWHDHNLSITDTELTENCRAALWYSNDISITHSKLYGIKALRECADILISECDIVSPEFGWSSRNITVNNSRAVGEYFMLRAENLRFSDFEFKGKYSFQYIKDAVFENCCFDTKDAFWHADNVVVRNCTVKGEYLAWYSKNITFDHCTIIGTQPLCYCKNLRLICCEMRDTDLCFEKSEVEASLTSPVISIKNPLSGHICVPSVGEIICDDCNAKGKIIVGKGCCCCKK